MKYIIILTLFCLSLVSEARPRYYKHRLTRGKTFASAYYKHHSPLQIRACKKAKNKRAKLTRRNLRYPTYLGSGR